MTKPSPHSNVLRAVLLFPCCLVEHKLCPTTERMIKLVTDIGTEPSDMEKILFIITSGGTNLKGLDRSRVSTQILFELSDAYLQKFEKLPHCENLQSDDPLVEMQDAATMLKLSYKSVEKIDIFCQSAAYEMLQRQWNDMIRRTGRWLKVSVNFNPVPPHM